MRLDAEGQVAQYLWTEPVAQAHIFKSDHVPSPEARRLFHPDSAFIHTCRDFAPRRPTYWPVRRARPSMVSNSLTDRLIRSRTSDLSAPIRHADRLPQLRDIVPGRV